MATGVVSESLCGDLRTQAGDGATSGELAELYEISIGTIQYHIYGDCGHDIDPRPLAPESPEIPDSECRQIRSQFAAGTDVDDIAEEFDHTWKTTVRHLSGECSHEDDGLAVERQEILQHRPVSADACTSLRETYQKNESSDLLTLSRTVPWSYQTVLRHINGVCSHEVELKSREIGKRTHISAEQCQQFREQYRNDTSLTLSDLGPLAAESDATEGSIKRHIRFRCSHDPNSTLLDKIDGWETLVDDGIEEDTEPATEVAEPEPDIEPTDTDIDYTTIADETGISSLDSAEVVADIDEPDPQRVETTTARIVRNTTLAKELKEYYQHHCQLCGEARHKDPLEHYSEAHHLKPLGRPHDGPDIKSNIFILCPNHHADFDHGLVYIDPETYEITHATDKSLSGETLRIRDEHKIDLEFIEYHNNKISKL